MAKDAKYGQIDIPGVPDDEPVFVIRGQDKSAPQIINQYADLSITNGSPSEHGSAARRVSSEIRTWQEENPDKVKVAD